MLSSHPHLCILDGVFFCRFIRQYYYKCATEHNNSLLLVSIMLHVSVLLTGHYQAYKYIPKHKYVCKFNTVNLRARRFHNHVLNFVALNGKCLFSCLFHRSKYFSGIGCFFKKHDSFLWLKCSVLLVTLVMGERGYSWNTICLPRGLCWHLKYRTMSVLLYLR
jgi:hypothetical protein